MSSKELPAELARGFSKLKKFVENTEGRLQLGDEGLVASPEIGCWSLRFTIHLAQSWSPWVPETTEWYALISGNYPFGELQILPSQAKGITGTFPHQIRNDLPNGNNPWRRGWICVETLEAHLGTPGTERDPIGESLKRLTWNFAQAIRWVEAAAENRLTTTGEAFELPFYPSVQSSHCIVHDEGPDTFPAWQNQNEAFGSLELRRTINDSFVALSFHDEMGGLVRSCSRSINGSENSITGFWWKWPGPIVLEPWQAPATWGELRTLGEQLDIDVDSRLKWVVHRAKSKATILLIGHAIPERIGGSETEIFWKGVCLENLPGKSNDREKKTVAWEKYRSLTLGNDRSIPFTATLNLHPDRLQGRGGWPEVMKNKSVAVIGLGSLGSSIVEVLARGGVFDWLLIDPDTVEAGNLVRHIASLKDLGKPKVEVVKERLLGISPWMQVQAYKDSFPEVVEEAEKLLDRFDIVLDCSASDSVARLLGSISWADPKIFASLSVGWEARRLFAFFGRDYRLPCLSFGEALRPWLLDEQSLYQDIDERFEGAGCWIPTFPARWAEMISAASFGARRLSRYLAFNAETYELSSALEVWEQSDESGFWRVEAPDP